MDIKTEILKSRVFYTEVNKKKLRVLELIHPAAGTKPTMVFLHEGLGCIELWKDFPHQLAAALEMNAIIYERQGYGKSDHLDLPRPKDYLEREALIWLPELLKNLNIQKPILIGHSDGASIALVYAGHHTCTALITEAAHIYVEDITIQGIEEVKANPDLEKIKEKLKKYHGEKTGDIFSAWADTWLSPGFRDWNIRKELQGINCPVLVIQGKDDEYASETHVTDILEAMPNASIKISLMPENCAHIPHLQAKKEVFEAMMTFIGDLSL